MCNHLNKKQQLVDYFEDSSKNVQNSTPFIFQTLPCDTENFPNTMSSSSYGFAIPSSLLPSDASPEWNNKADNAWQLTAATLVGLQSVPGLVILYGSMVKRKWAVNSSFMALYAFACVLICWVSWAHGMAFGGKLLPFVGKPNHALDGKFLLAKSSTGYFPIADFVFYQFAFAAITVVLLAGSLLGRMNFYAWMLFVPLWLTFSYTVGAFTIWDNSSFLQGKIIDYAGGFVIHLSSGIAGFTAAYWVHSFRNPYYFYKTVFVQVSRLKLSSTTTLLTSLEILANPNECG